MSKKYIAIIPLIITIYYAVFYVHSNSIYNIGVNIFDDDSYFDNNPPLVTDFINESENIWFTNIENFESESDGEEKQLYISSTILKGVSYCVVYHRHGYLTGEFVCKVAEPFWFLKWL